MADFNSAIWSILIAVVTLVSIIGLLWFTWAQANARRDDALLADLDTLDAIVAATVSLALIDAGYRKHHRGEWRRQRVAG